MSRSSMQSWWQQANLQAKHRKSGKVSWLFDIFGIWRSFNRRRPRHRCHKPHTRHADITPHGSCRTWLLPLADNSAYGQIYFFPLRLLPSVFPTHTLAYIIWPQLACFRIKVALVQFTLLCFALLAGQMKDVAVEILGAIVAIKIVCVHMPPSTAQVFCHSAYNPHPHACFHPAHSLSLSLDVSPFTLWPWSSSFARIPNRSKYPEILDYWSYSISPRYTCKYVCVCECACIAITYVCAGVGVDVVLDLPAAIDLRNY